MSKMNRNVLWAVDISTPDRKAITTAATVLKTLIGKTDRKVVPAYLSHVDETRLSPELLEKDKVFRNLPLNEKFEEALKGIKGLKLGTPEILRRKGVFRNADVDAFVSAAKEQGADFIVLTTHARKGLARFWLGSFAETMVLHSSVPLLLINPSLKAPKAFKTVFFPTDLSEGSKQVFGKLLPLALELQLSVTLYYRLESYQESTGLNLKPSASFKAMQGEFLKKSKVALSEFEKLANESGVKFKTILSQSGSSLTEDILKRTSKLAGGLIAMSARSGAIGGALVGSTARQVIRAASCPVWVLHEKSA